MPGFPANTRSLRHPAVGHRGPERRLWRWVGSNGILFAATLYVFTVLLVAGYEKEVEDAVGIAFAAGFYTLVVLPLYALPLLAYLFAVRNLTRGHRPRRARLVAVAGGALLSLLLAVVALVQDADRSATEILYAAFPLAFGAVMRLPPEASESPVSSQSGS